MITPLLAVWLSAALLQGEDYLYRTLLLRAAPGELLEVIDLLKERLPVYESAGEERPLIMRHSQGDHWDLLILHPMGSFADYFGPARRAAREQAARESGKAEDAYLRDLEQRIAWREELFVLGPPPSLVRAAFAENAYYHVEMFMALPTQRQALLEERRMENDYLRRIGRPENLIFTRVAGAAWDLYTIGFYRDIKHFAASADIPDARKDAAARAAGFEGADRIGTYLRSLISSHHDTLATAVR